MSLQNFKYELSYFILKYHTELLLSVVVSLGVLLTSNAFMAIYVFIVMCVFTYKIYLLDTQAALLKQYASAYQSKTISMASYIEEQVEYWEKTAEHMGHFDQDAKKEIEKVRDRSVNVLNALKLIQNNVHIDDVLKNFDENAQ